MALFEGRGYVSKPEAKTSAGGKQYSKFVLGVKQKDKQKDGTEKVTWANYFVTDFKNASPPAVKAFVTVKGYLTVKETEKDGAKRTFIEVNAQELEVAPPFDGPLPNASGGAGPGQPEKDPWE